ncbi:MAG TPA: FMN-binding protein, partial [Longimicrobiales bacterium]
MSAGTMDERDRGREMRLPTVGPDGTPENGADGSAGDAVDGAPAGTPGGSAPLREPSVSPFRLVATLAIAGALAGLVIVLVDQWSRPLIEANQARELAEAVYEVLGGPDSYRTAFLVDGSFTTEPPPEVDTTALEKIYVGYDASGGRVGVAVAGGEPGFQDIVSLIFGYDPAAREVLGMKVLDHKETPGLGDKIIKDTLFVAEFTGARAPLLGIKAGRATGAANEVDMITGATISSRVVIDIINHRLE